MDTTNLKHYLHSLELQKQHLNTELKDLDELIDILEALEAQETHQANPNEPSNQQTPNPVNGPGINIKFSSEMESKINEVLLIAKASEEEIIELPRKKPASEVLREAKQAEAEKTEQAKLTKQARLQQLEKAYLKNVKTKKSAFTKNSDKITNKKFKAKAESKSELPVIQAKPGKEAPKPASLQTLYPSKPEPMVEIVIEKTQKADFENPIKKKSHGFVLESRHITKAQTIEKIVAQNEKAVNRSLILPEANSRAQFLMTLTLYSFWDTALDPQLINPIDGMSCPNESVLGSVAFLEFLFKFSDIDGLIRHIPKSNLAEFLSDDLTIKKPTNGKITKLSLCASLYRLFACMYELSRQLWPSGPNIIAQTEIASPKKSSLEFWREKIDGDIQKFLQEPFSSDGKDRELFEILEQMRLLCYFASGKNSLFLINS
jgi:hypothetical protein